MDDPKPREGLARNPDGSIDYARPLLEFLELADAYATSPTLRRRRPRTTRRQKEIAKILGHVKILKERALVEAAWEIICKQNGLPHKALKDMQIAEALIRNFPPRPSKRRILNQLSAANTFMRTHEQSSSYRAYIQRIIWERFERPLLTN
jgi:hypothetical protein